MDLLKLIAAKTEATDLTEAKVGKTEVQLALSKMVSYLERKLNVKLVKIPGLEHFHNSADNGYGYRYVFSGTTKCIRFNWSSGGNMGNTANMTSIDLFMGKTRDPNFSIQTKGISFAKALPMLVTVLKSPSVGKLLVFPVNVKAALTESKVMEAKEETMTTKMALQDFLKKLSAGEIFSRDDFANTYNIDNIGIFDTVVDNFKDKFVIKNKHVGMMPGEHPTALYDSIITKAGSITVTTAGTEETYMKSPQEVELEKDTSNVIPYEDTLEHLADLVNALCKGASNSLFVVGPGGTGKTETVEATLHANGLSDGKGYYKITGSASAAGMYTELYHHRNDLILFDDSDGALGDQDSRNIVKAATDTKKIRKLSWAKKSSFIYDPETLMFPDMHEDDTTMAPKFFNFTGRVIFITNLTLDKLDPDGALRSRSFIININPSEDELFEHMGRILNKIRLEDGLFLSDEERLHVLEVVKQSKRKGEVSLRKLVRALNLAASGIANWEILCKLYA